MYKLISSKDEGEYITLTQAKTVFNLSVTTIRKIAEEAGAVRRIGRCYRINKAVLANYVEQCRR